MILVSLVWGNLMPALHLSALNLQPYLSQALNCTPALSCASTVTLCRLFPDRLFVLLYELLLPFGGGLAGRFWALRTRIPSSARVCRVRGLQCFFSFFVMTSAIICRSHAPCSNPCPVGSWRSISLTISSSLAPARPLHPAAFCQICCPVHACAPSKATPAR